METGPNPTWKSILAHRKLANFAVRPRAMGAVFVILIALVVVFCASAQMGASSKEKGKVLKKDVPLIDCEACELVVDVLEQTVTNLRDDAPYNKIGELDIMETIEKICDPKDKTGKWTRMIDITENDDRSLSLIRMDSPSKCEHECKTISYSCNSLLDDEIDKDDLAAMLYMQKLDIKEMVKKVCIDWSGRCDSKGSSKKMGPKRKRLDYEFKPIEEKELEMEYMMASMNAMGMNGEIYNRDEMMASMGGMGGLGDMDGMGGMGDGYDDPYGGMGGMGGMDMDEMAANQGMVDEEGNDLGPDLDLEDSTD